MEIIYELSERGDLTEDVLQGVPVSEINKLHAESKLTPLGIALWKGHAECAKLLLKYKADPDGGRTGRPPLWVATLKAPTSEAEGLIQLLLDHNADASLASQVSATDKGSTPLWNAVKTRKSPEVISRLVDAGANPLHIVAEDNKSAYHLAKSFNDQARLSAMRARAGRTTDKVAQTSLVVSLVGAIVWWANASIRVSAAAAGVAIGAAGVAAASAMEAKDAILRRFKMRGWLDERFKKFEPKSVNEDDEKAKAEFRKHIRDFISEKRLEYFFPRYSAFLDNVVNGAVRLDRDPNNLLNTKDLARLALYKPILYCDDSKSMGTKTVEDRTSWTDQAELVQRIASITTRIIPKEGGIDLRFINKEEGLSKASQDQVKELTTRMTPDGGTEIGTNLKSKVLDPFFKEPFKKRKLLRPLLISITTGGAPGSAAGKDTKKTEDNVAVRFQISQIGSDPEAGAFLRKLEASGLEDVLHVTSDQLDQKFGKFRRNNAELEQWLLELLMSPIVQADPN
ncbi:ankyrin repeat protein [Cordyceps javanica]|nr:ankyrin repeat protein [Cordyceps javanica]